MPVPTHLAPPLTSDGPVPFAGRALPALDDARRPDTNGRSRPPLTVIVAEDSEPQRLMMCSHLTRLGFKAVEAADGREALDLIRHSGAQILISDLRMPVMDGIELARRVRQVGLAHYVHVIMVTGADEAGLRRGALGAGVDDFIPKGSDLSILEARLRTATRLIAHAADLADRTRTVAEMNRRIVEDLRAAASAQWRLLPTLRRDVPGLSLASAFIPSDVVSGDMFGCFELGTGSIGFYVVDVSGHGVRASLLSVGIGHLVTPGFFADHSFDRSGRPDPAALARTLNAKLCRPDTEDYMTLLCGIIDPATGRMDYCQAGYPSPLCLSATGGIEEIGTGGFPVGLIEAAVFDNRVHHIAAGGALVICSDAASEAQGPGTGRFGSAGLREAARSAAMQPDLDIPRTLVAALAEWRGGLPLEDDLTVVAFRRTCLS